MNQDTQAPEACLQPALTPHWPHAFQDASSRGSAYGDLAPYDFTLQKVLANTSNKCTPSMPPFGMSCPGFIVQPAVRPCQLTGTLLIVADTLSQVLRPTQQLFSISLPSAGAGPNPAKTRVFRPSSPIRRLERPADAEAGRSWSRPAQCICPRTL